MRARSNACWSPPAKSVLQSTDYSAVNDSGGVRGSDPQDLRPRFRRLGGMSVDKRMGRPSRLHPDCIPGLCGRGAFNSEPRFRFRACAAVVFATFSGSISRFLAGAPAPCCDGHRKEKRETEGFPYRHKATERSVNARAWIGCSKEASPMPRFPQMTIVSTQAALRVSDFCAEVGHFLNERRRRAAVGPVNEGRDGSLTLPGPVQDGLRQTSWAGDS